MRIRLFPGTSAGSWLTLAVVLGSAIAGYWIAAGSMRWLVALLIGLAVVLGFAGAPVLESLLLIATAFFDEYAYGTLDPGSYFLLRRHVIPYANVPIDEAILLLLIGLMVLRLLRGEKLNMPGRIVSGGVVTVLLVYVLQFLRAIADGYGIWESYAIQSGKYVVLFGVCVVLFMQLLGTPERRLKLLDALYVLCGLRAVYAAGRFFLGNGDPANAYRSTVSKVALWDSSDHLLFAFLAVVVLSAWLHHAAVGRRRLHLWMTASIPMVLVVATSFRRIGTIGLLLSVALCGALLWDRGGKKVLGLAGLGSIAVSAVSYQRFTSGDSLLARVFPDLSASSPISRLSEIAFAWTTIVQSPILGGGLLAERSGGSQVWTRLIVHSGVLFVWMKLGIIGLLGVLAVISGAYARGVRAIARGGPERYLAVGLVSMSPFLVMEMGWSTPLLQIRTMLTYAAFMAMMCLLGSDESSFRGRR